MEVDWWEIWHQLCFIFVDTAFLLCRALLLIIIQVVSVYSHLPLQGQNIQCTYYYLDLNSTSYDLIVKSNVIEEEKADILVHRIENTRVYYVNTGASLGVHFSRSFLFKTSPKGSWRIFLSVQGLSSGHYSITFSFLSKIKEIFALERESKYTLRAWFIYYLYYLSEINRVRNGRYY